MPLAEAADERLRRAIDEIVSGKEAAAEFIGNDTKLKDLAKRSLFETLQEVEALSQLERIFAAPLPRPLLGGWAMTPTAMLALVAEIRRTRPELVVELGSGTSTVWIAAALKANGRGRLVSVDHLEEYRDKTLLALGSAGLEDWVDVRWAPLGKTTLAGKTYTWYDRSGLQGLAGVDMLIVDGPPGSTGPNARYPGLPLLEEALSDEATIVVDDADRAPELAMIKRWRSEVAGLGEAVKLAPRTQAIPFRRTGGAE